MVKSSRSSSRSINSNSDLVKCAGQIKAMGFSLFLFVIAMIIFSSIPVSEFNKILYKPPTDNEVPPNSEVTKLLPETVNKFYAIIGILFVSFIIFVGSIVLATNKGCYKTSIFGLLFGLLFGIF